MPPSSVFKFEPNRHLVSPNSLLTAIKSRANKKSCGEDKISNYIIKKLSPRFRSAIAKLFNQAFNIAYFPTAWKSAIVIPILKTGKQANDPSSYRPISMLSCLGKLFERCVKQSIDDECNRLNIIPPDQFSHKSTTHPLIKFSNDITMNLNKRTPTIACTLDVEKAFDTVWTDGLLYKLHSTYKFNTHICCLIKSYLQNREFKVKVDDKLSVAYSITAGVPQGGVLSSLLYILYVSDLPIPPQDAHPIQRLQYADDILLYVSVMNLTDGQNRMSAYLSQIQTFLERWKIKLNPGKAQSIVFKGTIKQHCKTVNKSHNKVQLRMNQEPIPLNGDIKYLGVIYKKRPTFVSHVTEAIKRANGAFHQIKHILRSTSKLNVNIKLLCYKQLIRPVLSYGYPAWAGISSHQMERLRVFERRCIRACINYRRPPDTYKTISNVELYKQGTTKRFDNFVIDNAIKTFDKWPACPFLQNCIQHDIDQMNDPRAPYKPPWYIIHLLDTGQLYANSTPILYHTRSTIAMRHLGTVYSTAT